jgi:acetyl-CoA C-acetyltransferase
MEKRDIVIIGGARTAIGRYSGAFKNTPAHVLGGIVIKEALGRAGVAPAEVDEVIMGQVGGVGPDAFNARRCALEAGLPTTSTAMNVNRLCGSGLQSIWSAAQEIMTGSADVVVAGGDENMTMQPFFDYGARDGWKLGDRTLVDGTLSLVTDPFGYYPMGMTAEKVAQKFGVSRDEQDRFALESQRKAAVAMESCYFREQIVPVTVKERKSETTIDRDEHPRADTTIEQLAKLRPAFSEGGSVTAGNSSGINDAAAAVVVTSEAHAQEGGWKPWLRLIDVAVAGIDPEVMGYAPALAIAKVLERNGLTPDDIDQLELNEAFAAQAVAVIRDTNFPADRVNLNGGAIALGHPVGATGTILTVKLMYEMKRLGHRLGMVSMCIGGGQALAAIFENVA